MYYMYTVCCFIINSSKLCNKGVRYINFQKETLLFPSWLIKLEISSEIL